MQFAKISSQKCVLHLSNVFNVNIALKGQFIFLISALPNLVSLKITWFFSHLKFKFSFHNISLTLCREIDYIFHSLKQNFLLCSTNIAWCVVFFFLSHCLAGESSHHNMTAHTFQHSEKLLHYQSEMKFALLFPTLLQFFSKRPTRTRYNFSGETVARFPGGAVFDCQYCCKCYVVVTSSQCFKGSDLACTEQPPPSPLTCVLTLHFYQDKPQDTRGHEDVDIVL